jgi:hypothetical protein
MKRLVILVAAVALVAAACGDDDGGDRDQAIATLQRQITESQTAQESPTAPQFTDAEARCMAEGMVDEFGISRILDAEDQAFEEFMGAATAEERRNVVDLTLNCVDLTAQLTGPLVAEGLSEESAECIGAALIDNEAFRDVLAAGLATGSFDPTSENEAALMEALFPALFECLSAEELANFGG